MKKITLTLSLMAILVVFGLAGSANAAGGYIGTGFGYAFPNFDLNKGADMHERGNFSWEFLHGGYNFTDNIGVSAQWGGAGLSGTFYNQDGDKETENIGIGYIDINLRLTLPMEMIAPYGELGIGAYGFGGTIPGGNLVSNESSMGYRAAVGAMVPIGNFYLAPELAYNWVQMDGADYDGHDIGHDLGTTNFGMILLKAGYSFGN